MIKMAKSRITQHKSFVPYGIHTNFYFAKNFFYAENVRRNAWTRQKQKEVIVIMAKQLICTNCGYIGYPKRITKGSFWIEVVLWLFFLVPGLIYSIWRLTTKYDACPKCKNASMIPIDTPRGQKLLEEQQK
jgi:hypothetical protein